MSGRVPREPLEALREIERRCRASAVGLPLQVEVRELWSGVGFRIGATRFVAPLGEVQEILTQPGLSRVPGTKGWVKGIANVRGNLLPIMDLKGYLGRAPTVPGRSTRVLVINQQGTFAGLLVDEVLGLKYFPVEDRTTGLPYVEEAVRPYLTEAYLSGGEHWAVFSMKHLAETPQFLHAAR